MREKLKFWMLFFVCAVLSNISMAAQPDVPEPFRQFDASSKRTIGYDVLTAWLDAVVLDIGRSDRRKAAPTHPLTGTRIKAKFRRSTLYEGNRVYFESFLVNGESRRLLRNIQKSLEQLPDREPLKYFNRAEQLAFWLNLYNFTILNEIANVYPERYLEDLLVGEDSILNKKLLSVSGVRLSLNDIQFTILQNNYNNDPLIIYGLYQGVIGGPNIRRTAYSGKNVYRALAENAVEFVNSNRGTSRIGMHSSTFKVSNFYIRNASWFPDFESDLKAHLMKYLEGPERDHLASASIINGGIDDWTVTDLFGTYPVIRNGMATNPAALMGAVVSTTPADPAYGGGGVTAAAGSGGAVSLLAKTGIGMKRNPEAFRHLRILNAKRIENNRSKAKVSVEDLADDAESLDDEKPRSTE